MNAPFPFRFVLPALAAAVWTAPLAGAQTADDRYQDVSGREVRDLERTDLRDTRDLERTRVREARDLDRRDYDGREVERSVERDRAGAYGPREGAWELTLSGTGNSDKEFDSNSVGITVDASHYFSELLSAGVRQTVSATGDREDNAWSGSTAGFGQLHFGDTKLRPYIGVELGYLYGDGVNETFFGGPEAGLRYYVKDEAFLFGRASYQFLFDRGDEAVDRFDDGRFVYTFGVGFNF